MSATLPPDALLRFADTLAPPADSEPVLAADELHLVTFTLGSEEYGAPIRQVREVVRVGEITRVPHAPAHMRGVMNLRGRVLPVLELRSRLGLPPAELSTRSRVLVVEAHGRLLGLLVDAVRNVSRIPASAASAPPDDVRCAEAEYITGMARWEGRLIILLDLAATLLLKD